MTKHGILEANAGAIIDPDEATFRQHPQYFQAGTLAQERMMSDEVNTLQRLHYFTGWNTALGKPSPQTPVKVGIISIDIPQWERPLKSVLLPALGRIGHAPADADIIRVHNPNAASEDGATVSQIESAFFKFRSDGVTHVILLDASGSFLLIGAPTARGQNYYPRFGINSGSGAQAIYDNGTVTSKQLAGAVGLGWLPGLDLPANQGPKYATAATRQCLQNIERRTGQKFTSTNAEGLALSYCDEIGVLTFALRRITGPITLQNGISAMESVGSAYKPAGLPTSFYGPGRHDAVNTGFDLIWRTSCSCATYVGRHTIP